jgi:hypothetical protein
MAYCYTIIKVPTVRKVVEFGRPAVDAMRSSGPSTPVARGRRTRVLCSAEAESADLGCFGLAFGARKPLWLW